LIDTMRRDIQFGVTLAGTGLALFLQIPSHPEFIVPEVLLALASSYLVLRHL